MGVLLQTLDRRYRCTGIDLSAGMLRRAKERGTSAELIRGNIAKFDLKQSFDVILSLFDTINHLTKVRYGVKLFAERRCT